LEGVKWAEIAGIRHGGHPDETLVRLYTGQHEEALACAVKTITLGTSGEEGSRGNWLTKVERKVSCMCVCACISVGAWSTLGTRHFDLPENICRKINKMPEFYICPKKLTICPNFTHYLSLRICPKNIFPRISGGGQMLPYLPVFYACVHVCGSF